MNLLRNLFTKSKASNLKSSDKDNILTVEDKNILHKTDNTKSVSVISKENEINIQDCLRVYNKLKKKWKITNHRYETLYKYLYDTEFARFLIGAILNELEAANYNSAVYFRDKKYYENYLESNTTLTDYYYVDSKVRALSFIYNNINTFITNCKSRNLSNSHHAIGVSYLSDTLQIEYITKHIGQSCNISVIKDDLFFVTNYMSIEDFIACINS